MSAKHVVDVGDRGQIDRHAARQHGVFSAAQARRAGYDRHAVARKLASGEWRQHDYRVFGLTSAPATWERQLWVAILSRPKAVVGGLSAAHLHGFRGFGATRPAIVVPGSANARSIVARIIRSEHFDEIETTRISGFPVTSVAETVLTIAADISPVRLEQTVDDLLLAGSLEVVQLERLVDREDGRRRKGIVTLRQLVEDRSPDAPMRDASYLEKMLHRLLRKTRMPTWVTEHPFSLNGGSSRVDVFVPAWNLVIEADGRNWHARVEDFETDRRRDNELATRGVQVLRFTFRMLKSDSEGCLATIRDVGLVRSA